MDKAIKTPNRTGILVRALIVLAMCGIVNSAAVFVSPMAKHFGWTTEAIAGVATYMAFMQTPGHILSGWLLGKLGAKKTLILGCILLGLAFLLSGMVCDGKKIIPGVCCLYFYGTDAYGTDRPPSERESTGLQDC